MSEPPVIDRTGPSATAVEGTPTVSEGAAAVTTLPPALVRQTHHNLSPRGRGELTSSADAADSSYTADPPAQAPATPSTVPPAVRVHSSPSPNPGSAGSPQALPSREGGNVTLRPAGSDLPLPGVFREVSTGTLEVPGGEPITYTRIRPQKPNGSIVIFVRGYGHTYPIETHVLARELVGRGYTLYTYASEKSLDWDHQASLHRDFVGSVRRENEGAAIHLVATSFGANGVRRFLETPDGRFVFTVVFTCPAFGVPPSVARRHQLPETLYPSEGRNILQPSFWVFARQDEIVDNERAVSDRRFFVGHREEVSFDATHQLYKDDDDKPAKAIADWVDRYGILNKTFTKKKH